MSSCVVFSSQMGLIHESAQSSFSDKYKMSRFERRHISNTLVAVHPYLAFTVHRQRKRGSEWYSPEHPLSSSGNQEEGSSYCWCKDIFHINLGRVTEKKTWAEISCVPSCETKMLHNALLQFMDGSEHIYGL